MSNIFKKITAALALQTNDDLDTMMKAWDRQWADTLMDTDIKAKRAAVKTRKDKVEWIMDSDPILEEGGLRDFLVVLQRLGVFKTDLDMGCVGHAKENGTAQALKGWARHLKVKMPKPLGKCPVPECDEVLYHSQKACDLCRTAADERNQ